MKPIDLTEHPEGGRFREVFRSDARVVTSTGQQRSALTHIYFALDEGETSSFHRVASDEVWNLYSGDGLHLYLWDPSSLVIEQVELSATANRFCHVVPAGFWQAAMPLRGPVLTGCSVGPGFEFSDFTLMKAGAPEASQLLDLDPTLWRFISR